jgi:hypothetical protein
MLQGKRYYMPQNVSTKTGDHTPAPKATRLDTNARDTYTLPFALAVKSLPVTSQSGM